jgi:hypothetical protein
VWVPGLWVGAATSAPPPLRVEVVGRAPSVRHVWVAGHWQWNGASWVWMGGHWVVRRAGSVWIAGHWDRKGGRYVFVPGHWR